MKLLTVLGAIAIVLHQIFLEKITSLLFIEIVSLAVFYWLGTKLAKEYNRERERRSHYFDRFNDRYIRPKENKSWRDYRSKTEITPSSRNWTEELK